MQWTVDVRTVRRHDATGDLPVGQEATIELGKATDTEPATLADFRALLTTAVSNLGIPGTAVVIDNVRLSLRWP